jgi:hypothetical protein
MVFDIPPTNGAAIKVLDREKGDSPHLCEAPFGPFRQMGTVPFFLFSPGSDAIFPAVRLLPRRRRRRRAQGALPHQRAAAMLSAWAKWLGSIFSSSSTSASIV